ncbi:MAG: ATP-grasp domain-containing protein [Gemmataceae bacterium]|nr:ATP-grasp domain-containing protein [Gemmataceae bacterium]MDW8263926.1 ATP-grasp domain-containing protein [Gemmataceae bacterium]
MRIGLCFDLKDDRVLPADAPEDWQEEFDSPATIEAIAEVLRSLGHEPVLLGDGPAMLRRLLVEPPDLVFNLAEGQGVGRCREARVPAVLELLGIPYTGSDPLTLAATLDKDCAKRLVASHGVSVPRSVLVTSPGPSQLEECQRRMARWACPVVVKPAWEGSSKGIRQNCLIDRPEELPTIVESVHRDHRQPVLVEEYVAGDELTVGVLGNEPPRMLGIMRVVPQRPTERFIYSLEVKRDFRRRVRYECPAPLSPAAAEAVEKAALVAFQALGCRDVARIDFRLRDGVPVFLELNPLPGLAPETSDLVIMAHMLGWSYSRLIETILGSAWERLHRQRTAVPNPAPHHANAPCPHPAQRTDPAH